MKLNNFLIPLVAIIGILVLFFFPSPEDNFILYVSTAVIFIILVFVIAMIGRKK